MPVVINHLTAPEVILLEFLRRFFEQGELVEELENKFIFAGRDATSNTRFHINLAWVYNNQTENVLPAVVIEDGPWRFMGSSIDNLRDYNIPAATEDFMDLLQGGCTIHCFSREREEAKLLAAIVSRAIMALRRELRESGFNKVDPVSGGSPIPVELNSQSEAWDVPIQLSYTWASSWQIREDGDLWENLRPVLGILPSFQETGIASSMIIEAVDSVGAQVRLNIAELP